MTEPVAVTPQEIAKAITFLLDENDRLTRELADAKESNGGGNKPKLTKREVEAIRKLHRAGHKHAEIAEIYDVNKTTISRIVRGIYHK